MALSHNNAVKQATKSALEIAARIVPCVINVVSVDYMLEES